MVTIVEYTTHKRAINAYPLLSFFHGTGGDGSGGGWVALCVLPLSGLWLYGPPLHLPR